LIEQFVLIFLINKKENKDTQIIIIDQFFIIFLINKKENKDTQIIIIDQFFMKKNIKNGALWR
jgi:hypothetical protein